MSLYDRIKPYLDKTDAEIAAIPGLMDDPRKIPVWQLDAIAQGSGLKASLRVATQNAQVQANPQLLGAVWAALDLFDSKFDNLDLTDAVYRTGVVAVVTGLNQAGLLSSELKTQILELGGIGRPNPTEAEVAAARAEGEWKDARLAVEQEIDARFDAYRVAYNEAKNTLGELTVGSEIPSAESLWA